jgi:hypothetical protein
MPSLSARLSRESCIRPSKSSRSRESWTSRPVVSMGTGGWADRGLWEACCFASARFKAVPPSSSGEKPRHGSAKTAVLGDRSTGILSPGAFDRPRSSMGDRERAHPGAGAPFAGGGRPEIASLTHEQPSHEAAGGRSCATGERGQNRRQCQTRFERRCRYWYADRAGACAVGSAFELCAWSHRRRNRGTQCNQGN